MVTKFRLSDHTLEVETRRFKNISRKTEIVKIDDEQHYLVVKKLKFVK